MGRARPRRSAPGPGLRREKGPRPAEPSLPIPKHGERERLEAPSLGSQGNPARTGNRGRGREPRTAPASAASHRTAYLRAAPLPRPLLGERPGPAAPPRPSAANGDRTAPSYRNALLAPGGGRCRGGRADRAALAERYRGAAHLSPTERPQPNTR